MAGYNVVVNLEITGKCNARCAMCPRASIANPKIMDSDTFAKVLDRVCPEDVSRVILAGYGEPTSHPRFPEFLEMLRGHPVQFFMTTNGQLLDEGLLSRMDGVLDMVLLSFSSIVPEVYASVHRNLDHERVKQNITLAQKTFKKTKLAISLSPLPECLETLPKTIAWLKQQGVSILTMSPTLYNRAGALTDVMESTARLRAMIRKYGLLSQEMLFVPSAGNVFFQYMRNSHRCLARNSNLFISANGDYLYCYNDISHLNGIGNVDTMPIREVLRLREKMGPINELCEGCNMQGRYNLREIAQVAGKYIGGKLSSQQVAA